MKRLAIILGFMLVGALSAHADTPAEQLTHGNDAYQRGDYAAAATAYNQIVSSGSGTAGVYFNLGTAQLKAGQRGSAILSFERALRLDPSDADAAFNLAEAQKGNIDKIIGATEEAPLIERLGAQVPERAAGLAFLLAWLIGHGILLARWFWRRSSVVLGWAGGAALAAALLLGPLFALGAWERSHSPYAIVVTQMAPVREGPAKDFKATFEIHEGLKVRVLRNENGFVRIRLPNGTEGWVDDHQAATI